MFEILCWMGTLMWFHLEGCLGCGCWSLHGPRLFLLVKHGKFGAAPGLQCGIGADRGIYTSSRVDMGFFELQKYGKIWKNSWQLMYKIESWACSTDQQMFEMQTRSNKFLRLCFRKIGKGDPHHDACSSKAEDQLVLLFTKRIYSIYSKIQRPHMLSPMGASTLRHPHVCMCACMYICINHR